MYILSAYKDNKEIFTITKQMTREELVFLRNTSHFTCPQCETPLRLKLGKVVIPHFAHIVLTNCLTSFSERESPTHLIGKQQLAEFFTRVGCEVSVEAYLPKIAQRPDLLVKRNKKLYAVEFQCSVMPIDDVLKRNQGYFKIKTRSIWLLRTPLNMQINEIGITYIKLSKFMQNFIEIQSISGATILTYDPTTYQFIYISHLMHISGTSFIAKIRALSTKQQTFPFAQVKPLTLTESKQYWSIFQHKRIRFLRNRIRMNKYGVKDKLLKHCYEQQLRPENLPLYIGFPISESETIQNHLVEWQLALICTLSKQQHEDINCISDMWIESFIFAQCKVVHLEKAKLVVRRYCRFLQVINYNINESISEQFISDSKLLDHFEEVIVAKRCEN